MKFDNCILHIGPPKTGSTSVQKTFAANRDLLHTRSVHYPNLEQNHKFLVSAHLKYPEEFDYNKHAGRGPEETSEHNKWALAEFERNAEKSGCRKLLLSAEHFVTYAAEEIEYLQRYLTTIATETKVVFYARHPVSQVGSYIQEALKNGARNWESVRERPPFLRFADVLPAWSDVFGKENIIVRPFDPDHLEGRDVIFDLASLAGVEKEALIGNEIRENEGLSGAAVLIAGALAETKPKFSKQRGPQSYLSRIRGPKYVPDMVIIEKTREIAIKHVQYLRDEWGVVLSEPSIPEARGEPFDAAAISSIAEILNEYSRKLATR